MQYKPIGADPVRYRRPRHAPEPPIGPFKVKPVIMHHHPIRNRILIWFVILLTGALLCRGFIYLGHESEKIWSRTLIQSEK